MNRLFKSFVVATFSMLATVSFSAGTSAKKPVKRMTFPSWFAGIPVTTSPYLGEQSRFNMDDLLVMVPSVNEDLRLLYFRQHGEASLRAVQGKFTDKPYIKVSGKLTTEASSISEAGAGATNDFNLTDAELDVLMAVSPLITGYFTLNYDSKAADNDPVRVDNSRYFLDKGFFTLGNLDRSPFYATVGQLYIPFGRYSSAMNSGSLAGSLGKTKTRAMVIGYSASEIGPYGSAYLFRGNTIIGGTSNRINQGGVNLDYVVKQGDYYTDFGASWISNIAEANGLQHTGGSFSGFGESSTTEALQRRVPGVNGHIIVRYKKLNLNAEYVTATRAFDSSELSFNGQGAKPSVFNFELGYGFNYAGFASNLTAGYAHSHDSLALNLPKDRYVATLSTSLHQGTIQSIELRHDKLYSVTDNASGAGGTAFSAAGKRTNAITLDLGIYF